MTVKPTTKGINMFKTRIASLAVALAAAGGLVGAGAASASTTAPNIAVGATGYKVKCVQVAINYHYGVNIGVDGIYGSTTKSWVQRLQGDAGLTKDGIVGKYTGNLLMGTLNKTGHSDCYAYIPTTS
jgi:peptidoglycan hydrolase-like protein with peptidoglycan-binding domain